MMLEFLTKLKRRKKKEIFDWKKNQRTQTKRKAKRQQKRAKKTEKKRRNKKNCAPMN